MKLTSMQFDGDGGYDTPMNAGATAAAASSAYQDGDDRIARNSAAAGRAAKADKIATALTPTPGLAADDAHKGMMSRSNAMSPMTQATPAAKAKAPKAIDKSNWDKGTKVPQSTVDAVKDAGRGNMGKVPQRIVKNDAIGLSAPGYVGSQLQYNAPVSKEYKEAVKRVYPNEVKTPKTPTFNESSPNAKPFPKIAAPKTKIETVKKLRNAEIEAANKTAPDGKFAAAVINAGKAGAEAYGASTKTRYQIPGTQTKTQKAQAERRAEMASNKTAAASKPAATEKIKVSQATVDAVKKAGKEKSTGAANTKGASAEYREAVKRIYPTSKKK
jgi:hypothetical protein